MDWVKFTSQSYQHCSKYLIGGIRAQHVQWWGDELRFDRDCVIALFFSSLKSLLDGVNAGRCVTCKLDVGAEFYGLGSQTAGNRGGEDGKGGSGDGLREGRENSFGFAAYPILLAITEGA